MKTRSISACVTAALIVATGCGSKVGATGGTGAATTTSGQGGHGAQGGEGGHGGQGGEGGHGGHGGSVPFTGVGAPCGGGCATGFCSAGLYCTMDCTTDADCAPSAGASPNRCLSTSYPGEQQCFPGCTSDADCMSGSGPVHADLKCRSVDSGGKICTLAQDTGTPPACQPTNPEVNTSCGFTNGCTCGEDCFNFADGSNGTYCSYHCTTAQDCITASHGVWTKCWMGNGVGHCDM